MEDSFVLTVDFSPVVDPFHVVQSASADVFTLPPAVEEAGNANSLYSEDGSEFSIVDGFIVHNGLQIEAFGSIDETLAAYGGSENLKIGLALIAANGDDDATYAIIMGAVDGAFG